MNLTVNITRDLMSYDCGDSELLLTSNTKIENTDIKASVSHDAEQETFEAP